MSTRPRASVRTAAGSVVVALALAACGGPDPATPAPSDPATSSTAAAGAATAQPGDAPTVPDLPKVSSDVVSDLQAVLDARSAAILDGDREAFVATLADDPRLRTAETGYFANLDQLPLAMLTYRVVPASLVRTGDSYWGVVQVDLQLTPYDAVPVRTADRFRFDRRGGPGRFVVGSTTDATWEAANLEVQQPWDTEPVTVREGDGVLGVFDTADIRERAGIVASVERGLLDIGGRVPYAEWGRQAVVYALSDPRFLDSFDNVPGGDPEALDGVAFTVPAGTDDDTVAAMRIALSPELLPLVSARRVDPYVDRLVRHELVHVAVGSHDDAAPVWLSEGVAEWASVQALAPSRREVPQQAIAAARRGIDTMPDDSSFNDEDAAVHYALAWWVCEWLAETYGPDAPWTVLDAFDARAGEDQRTIVRDLLDMSVDQLAKRGANLLAATYAPPPPPETTSPTPTPGAASPSPASDYSIID